ncbi:SRPBCC domain-containing protein [Aquihabitans daechungensis]|uniref:SRPBCC family protein n=1 Tax=Aquihabitans daechungensis TaxID=1052257 RepID=UPI003BA255D9
MEPAAGAVTRSIDLPVTADEAWASIRDAEGLVGWLGDSVELDEIVAGAAGTVREGDAVRRLVVTEVDEGRSVGFVWWDEAAPQEASVVRIVLTPADEGTTVTVTERMAGTASASIGAASVGDLFREDAWDRRLQALVGTCSLTDALV